MTDKNSSSKDDEGSSKPEHSQQCEDIRNCAQAGSAIAAILVAAVTLTGN
jgi:hypothetical protein